MAKAKTFEEQLQGLEDIISELEQGTLPLNELLKKYGDGVKLATSCREKLCAAEQKLEGNDEN